VIQKTGSMLVSADALHYKSESADQYGGDGHR